MYVSFHKTQIWQSISIINYSIPIINFLLLYLKMFNDFKFFMSTGSLFQSRASVNFKEFSPIQFLYVGMNKFASYLLS